jgi:molybdopterin-containing oxidoreductase family iron-sulfur binding subunit
MGCKSCVEACKVENNTGQNTFYMDVFRWEEGTYPNVKTMFLPRPCQHCDNAPCAKVCPVGARFKREDGLVLTNFNTCIGCRYCEVACPYSVNTFAWKKPADSQYFAWNKGEGDDVYGSGSVSDFTGNTDVPYQNPDHQKLYGTDGLLVAGSGHYIGVMQKCTFCVHRVEQVKVLHFGDLSDPNSEVSQLTGRNPEFRLLEELNTRPSVYYIKGTGPVDDARSLNTKARKVKAGGVR